MTYHLPFESVDVEALQAIAADYETTPEVFIVDAVREAIQHELDRAALMQDPRQRDTVATVRHCIRERLAGPHPPAYINWSAALELARSKGERMAERMRRLMKR